MEEGGLGEWEVGLERKWGGGRRGERERGRERCLKAV